MKYKAVPGVILTSLCGQYWLVTSGERYEINETTAFYYRKLADGTTTEDLITFAEDSFDVSSPTLLKEDILTLLNSLEEKHLIARCPH